MPAFLPNKNSAVQQEEPQGEKSQEETNTENFPFSTIKTEVAELYALNYLFALLTGSSSIYCNTCMHHPVKQFSAVPTPPPWFRS